MKDKPTKTFICRCKNKAKPEYATNKQITSAYWFKGKKALAYCKWCGKIMKEKHHTSRKILIKRNHRAYSIRKTNKCMICNAWLYHNNKSGLCREHYIQDWNRRRRER